MKNKNIVICNNIVDLRYLYGLSQRQLARKICVSKNTISNIEHGLCYPSLQTIFSLCRVFNCTFEEIFYIKVLDID